MERTHSSIVGFSLLHDVPEARLAAALSAQRRVVGAFPHLASASFTAGLSRLEVWGHGDPAERVRRQPDGSIVAIVGSPHGRVRWADLPDDLPAPGSLDQLELPWEGRVVLVRVSADGRSWTMWNDWVGSIPVFHAPVGAGRVASTLEPVVVAAAGLSADDIFLPALVSILINGHCLSDWTFYRTMKLAPPDSVAEWGEGGFRSRQLWIVQPSEDHWETAWSDLVDEMYELSRAAIANSVSAAPIWTVPLSAGLDSRLIAAVVSDMGVRSRAFAWGHRDTVDVVYSRKIAKVLGIPWTHVDLGDDYLTRYTRRWAEWFGSALHFHGMYQMAFLDAISSTASGPVVSGFAGESVAGLDDMTIEPQLCQMCDEWYTHWTLEATRGLLRVPSDQAAAAVSAELERQLDVLPGRRFQKDMLVYLRNRCHSFTGFHATLADYWRGVSVPYLDRRYARFCLSLPRHAVEGRRLQADVYRRHYGLLATIPGTHGDGPHVVTGRYLLKRRLADLLPARLRVGPLRGFRRSPPRMDVECVQAHGWKALWPVQEARERLAEWVDLPKVDLAYNAVMSSKDDVRPLRQLQSVQALAYRLLGT